FGAELQAVRLRLQELAQRIRLGARRGILAMRAAKDRAHPLLWRLGAALSAAIAMDRLGPDRAGLPGERQRQRRVREVGSAQGPRQVRVGIDDLAGVEDILGIEDCLDLAQDRLERAVLSGYP